MRARPSPKRSSALRSMKQIWQSLVRDPRVKLCSKPNKDSSFQVTVCQALFWYREPGYCSSGREAARAESGALSHMMLVTKTLSSPKNQTLVCQSHGKHFRNLLSCGLRYCHLNFFPEQNVHLAQFFYCAISLIFSDASATGFSK